jgi:hypothetical protein
VLTQLVTVGKGLIEGDYGGQLSVVHSSQQLHTWPDKAVSSLSTRGRGQTSRDVAKMDIFKSSYSLNTRQIRLNHLVPTIAQVLTNLISSRVVGYSEVGSQLPDCS